MSVGSDVVLRSGHGREAARLWAVPTRLVVGGVDPRPGPAQLPHVVRLGQQHSAQPVPLASGAARTESHSVSHSHPAANGQDRVAAVAADGSRLLGQTGVQPHRGGGPRAGQAASDRRALGLEPEADATASGFEADLRAPADRRHHLGTTCGPGRTTGRWSGPGTPGPLAVRDGCARGHRPGPDPGRLTSRTVGRRARRPHGRIAYRSGRGTGRRRPPRRSGRDLIAAYNGRACGPGDAYCRVSSRRLAPGVPGAEPGTGGARWVLRTTW